MRNTEHFLLKKPDAEDFYSVQTGNNNLDIIDAELYKTQNPDYEASEELEVLTTGESIFNAFGKIAKSISSLIRHMADENNPHGVTKSQVGLSNVPNVATNDQAPTYTSASSLSDLTSGEKISVAFGKIAKAISSFISHISTTATTSVSGHVKVDSELSSASTNPVQNKAIAAELANYAKTTLVSSGDFNDIVTPGFYTMKSASANKPASGSYYGLVVLKSDSGNYVEQIAFKESSHELYVRYLSGSTWSDWKKVLTEKNISQSTAVTATGTYALDAVEKNASVEGTLANQIDKLNTKIKYKYGLLSGTVNTQTIVGYPDGFSADNCVVAGIIVVNDNGGKYYNPKEVQCIDIGNEFVLYNTLSSFCGQNYRCMFLKL